MKNDKQITTEEKLLWLRLSLSKGIGPATFWKILKKSNGSIKDALKFVEPYPEKDAEDLFINYSKNGYHLITAQETSFPKKLKQIKDCPPIISAVGNLSLLNKKSIAIVGARNSSLLGKIFAEKIARNLGTNGFITISGMARGIDSAAHQGSIETGTIAVFAGGIDVVYPPENLQLYQSIIENNGLIISEMILKTPIDPSLFPRRNRIIAGIAECVVLIEAAIKSGSLTTAKFALEQGKEVFAAPGAPSDPRSKGCNLLIKQGAKLIDSVEDILNDILPNNFQNIQNEFDFSEDSVIEKNDIKESILSELSVIPVSIEILYQNQNCSLPHLLSILGDLEMEGRIKRHPNCEVSLI